MKLQIGVLEEILKRLNEMQGSDFKKSYDESKMPPAMEKMMDKDSMEGQEEMPHGIAIEKVEVMKPKKMGFDQKADDAIAEVSKKPDMMKMPEEEGKMEMEGMEEPDGDEMTEEELAEMIEQVLSAKKKA